MPRRWSRILSIFLLVLALLVAGCQQDATPAPTSGAAAPTVAPAPTNTAAPAGPTETLAPTAPASEESATAQDTPSVAPVSLSLPEPSLFEIGWLDRDPFAAGLVDPSALGAEDLEGASVYHMDVELSSDATMLAGQEEVLYTNREDVALEEIYFRLFPNLADGTTMIDGVMINGQDVAPSFELRDSAMRVPLTPALQPGESVVAKINYEVQVPTEGGGNYGTFV
ncbi:MAG TPA: hypothetical protein VE553_08010, partial [Candidatus Binatia bacterium]|nr:hypothetical protein [Candidatus Binatia bacterium]